MLQTACVHRTCRGQGAGGVRFWTYDTVEEYLREKLRRAGSQIPEYVFPNSVCVERFG